VAAPASPGARPHGHTRARLRAYGIAAYVDAGPARARVREFGEVGIGWRRVAMLAGLHAAVVSKLLYGDPRRGQAPCKRIRPETAAKILALEVSAELVAEGTPIDATGTKRRVHALVACGWSQQKLAARLGMAGSNFHLCITSERVTAGTARKIAALYDELWDQPPPESTQHEKVAASRSRRHARERGWPPPMAWDDDTIDDPDAEPEGTDIDHAPRLGLPPAEDLLWLADIESVTEIARRYRVRESSVKTALARAREKAA
jgi:transcriptional regulator with XRE-family HTH domain